MKKNKPEFWTDKEVERLGLDPLDGTLCRWKSCECKATVDKYIKKKNRS